VDLLTDGTRTVGAHIPVAGGLARTGLRYLDATGARAVQVYVSNPRGWALAEGHAEQDKAFRAGIEERAVPAFVHASLLVNLGSPAEATVERSRDTLVHALARAAEIGAVGVVFHAGSAVVQELEEKAFSQVRDVLLPLLDAYPGDDGGPRLLVEPSAGGGRSLAARVEDLGRYLDAVEHHPGLGVCFDTCHAWAAGHDLATPGGMAATLDALCEAVGPGRLALVHANDSKDAVGSTRDRHETIGTGSIGEAAFAELLAHPVTAGIPVVVETPSEGNSGHGHARDIATLNRL
jgi:deoxyribonuclease-4